MHHCTQSWSKASVVGDPGTILGLPSASYLPFVQQYWAAQCSSVLIVSLMGWRKLIPGRGSDGTWTRCCAESAYTVAAAPFGAVCRSFAPSQTPWEGYQRAI